MHNNHFQIRDPIHGVIFISQNERTIIDSLVFQRLRNIKQVGFLDFAFPSATHTRYTHSIGAMHVATKIFDKVFYSSSLDRHQLQMMRQVVRLAALLHDIGHPPLSHTTEMLMPKLGKLMPEANKVEHIKATHEDYTYKLIVDSKLTQLLEDNFQDLGISAKMVASLIEQSCSCNSFLVSGKDHLPILRQIISSEIDADRMDYLLRDSFFCGVNYGKFDIDWLIENLVSVTKNSQVFLGFKARAIFAFEDFLLSRYHMFASVYFHHTPIIMEKMLERFFCQNKDAFILPIDLDNYLELNDLDLWQTLRASKDQWAQRIVTRRPYVLLDESYHGLKENSDSTFSYETILDALKEANIDVICSQSKNVLSTYFGKIKNPLFVLNAQENAVPLEEFSPVFVRYRIPLELFRIYVDVKEKSKAKKIMGKIAKNNLA
jgi:uncharacterized protein